MGSRNFSSSEDKDGCKSPIFVFGCVVIAACFCLFAVMPYCNNLDDVVRETINACVYKGWPHLLNDQCVWVDRWVCSLWVTELVPWEKYYDCSCLKSGKVRRSGCQTPRRALTYVDRCVVPGLQLAEVLTCVDTERLPTLATPPLHSEIFSSSAALSSSKVISRRSQNVTQGSVAQQQPAPAVHILHK